MLKIPDKFVQRRLDMPMLRDFMDMKHELVLLEMVKSLCTKK